MTTLREYIRKQEPMKYRIRFKQTINSAISVSSNIEFNNIEELKEVLRKERIKYIVNGYYNFEDEYDTEDRTRTSVEDLTLAYALFSDILTRSYR